MICILAAHLPQPVGSLYGNVSTLGFDSFLSGMAIHEWGLVNETAR
jgi:hypothetical protein